MVKLIGVEIRGKCSDDYRFVVDSTLLGMRRHNIKLPKLVMVKANGGRAYPWRKMITMPSNGYNISVIPFVLIHECVHNLDYRGHNKRFYRRFIAICCSLNLNPNEWFKQEYKYGQMYWANYKKRR